MTVSPVAPRFGLTRLSVSQISFATADKLLGQMADPFINRRTGGPTLKIEYYKDDTDPQWTTQATVYNDEVQLTRRVDKTVTDPSQPNATIAMDVVGPTEKALSLSTVTKLVNALLGKRPFQLDHTPNGALPRLAADKKVNHL